MKLIKPTVLTDTMLVSSTAPETDYTAWSAATAYVVGDHCIRTTATTHRKYECLVNNTNFPPEDNLTGATPKWLDIGPTNRWAMFDNVVGTITSNASPLTVVINPGSVSGIALMELVGKTAEITLKTTTGGTVIYYEEINLDGTIITSFYDWFYQPYEQLTDFVLTDLPWHYTTPELTITITSTSTVSCGVCKFGEAIEIGRTEYGATAGIIDYTYKDTDAFGNTIVVERSFSKRANFKVSTDLVEFNHIFRTLSNLRATPCVWIGTETAFYEPLLIYGFFKDFSIDVAYPTMNYCSLEIEGLI